MIKYYFEPEDSDDPLMISAEDQAWDDATLKQLWDDYRVLFMSNGDGVIPVMVTHYESNNPIIVLGIEDDGTIQFPRHYSQYDFCFSAYWIDGLCADLQEAKRRIQNKTEL